LTTRNYKAISSLNQEPRPVGDSRSSKPAANVGANTRDFQEFQAEFRRKLGLIDSDRDTRPQQQPQQRPLADSRSGLIPADRNDRHPYSFHDGHGSKSTESRGVARTQESAADELSKKSREMYGRFLDYNERADPADQKSASRLLGIAGHNPETGERARTKRSIASNHEIDSGFASPSVYFPYIYSLKSHTNSITSITTDCFGKLWSASLDHTVKSWNVIPNSINLGTRLSSLSPPVTLAKHRKAVNVIEAHAREPLMFSGADDKLIGVWNCQDASFKRFYKGHQGCVVDLEVLDKSIISAGSDHCFRVLMSQSVPNS
jgi:hypothetical protein